MAYSLDFRRTVVENVESEMSWDEALSIFSIGRTSLDKWLKKYRRNGDLKDAPRSPNRQVRKIDSLALLKALEMTPDATLDELAISFKCWPSAIRKRLMKLGITRKKKRPLHRKK